MERKIPVSQVLISSRVRDSGDHGIRGSLQLRPPVEILSYRRRQLQVHKEVPLEDKMFLIVPAHCRRKHKGDCWRLTGACLGCGSMEHKIREYEFLGDLIELSFREFDVILGMDWLSRHRAIVDFRMKRVTLRTPNEDEVIFIGERSNHLSNVISTAIARKMVRKGCEAYLAYVIDTVKARPSVSDIPTVSEFLDVFPEELPGLPL